MACLVFGTSTCELPWEMECGFGSDMSFRVIVLALTAMFAAGHSALAEPMTLDFSWRGTHGCITLFPNPEIRLRNIPTDARSLSVTLTQGPREMGGQELQIPGDGILPYGAIRTFGPCNPGVYRWSAQAKSSTGQILSEAHQARVYPTDELAPEQP